MEVFKRKELNLISIYDPGTRTGLIAELGTMMTALMPDEIQLRLLTESVIHKLERLSDSEYDLIVARVAFIPEEDDYAR